VPVRVWEEVQALSRGLRLAERRWWFRVLRMRMGPSSRGARTGSVSPDHAALQRWRSGSCVLGTVSLSLRIGWRGIASVGLPRESACHVPSRDGLAGTHEATRAACCDRVLVDPQSGLDQFKTRAAHELERSPHRCQRSADCCYHQSTALGNDHNVQVIPANGFFLSGVVRGPQTTSRSLGLCVRARARLFHGRSPRTGGGVTGSHPAVGTDGADDDLVSGIYRAAREQVFLREKEGLSSGPTRPRSRRGGGIRAQSIFESGCEDHVGCQPRRARPRDQGPRSHLQPRTFPV